MLEFPSTTNATETASPTTAVRKALSSATLSAGWRPSRDNISGGSFAALNTLLLLDARSELFLPALSRSETPAGFLSLLAGCWGGMLALLREGRCEEGGKGGGEIGCLEDTWAG